MLGHAICSEKPDSGVQQDGRQVSSQGARCGPSNELLPCVWREGETESAVIPPFNEHGYLPAGVHIATLDEIAKRFGCDSEIRRVQMEFVHEFFATDRQSVGKGKIEVIP
jgi:hypothetical protein